MDEENTQLIGVTKDIIEKFLNNLEEVEFPNEQVQGLRKALIENGKNSEKVLLNVIFPEK